jgi:hypothetical protein
MLQLVTVFVNGIKNSKKSSALKEFSPGISDISYKGVFKVKTSLL